MNIKNVRLLILAVVVMCVADCFGDDDVVTHMTTQQKIDYAKRLRGAGCLGGAFDVLAESVADLVSEQSNSMKVADFYAPRLPNTNFGHVITIPTNIVFPDSICITSIYTGATNWAEQIDAKDHTNAVNDLARAGIICDVLGHSWRDGRQGEGGSITYADYHLGVYFRTCKVCGKTESRSEGEWK